MAADGADAATRITVSRLGKQKTLATGSVSIAAATGTPIMPTFVVDSPAGARELVLLIKPPLTVAPENRPEDVRRTFESFSRVIESVIEEYPHLMEWKRLKYAPDYESE